MNEPFVVGFNGKSMLVSKHCVINLDEVTAVLMDDNQKYGEIFIGQTKFGLDSEAFASIRKFFESVKSERLKKDALLNAELRGALATMNERLKKGSHIIEHDLLERIFKLLEKREEKGGES